MSATGYSVERNLLDFNLVMGLDWHCLHRRSGLLLYDCELLQADMNSMLPVYRTVIRGFIGLAAMLFLAVAMLVLRWLCDPSTP